MLIKHYSLIFALLILSVTVSSALFAQHKEQQEKVGGNQFMIPQPLKTEHQELHGELEKAIKSGGRTGVAAKVVADLLHPHFVKEEQYALPPLGALSSLAEGKLPPDSASILAMTDKLKAELPQMIQEHKKIVGALENLSEAAKEENKPEQVRFVEKLILHAQTEEEILYPASILIGEYLKLKVGK